MILHFSLFAKDLLDYNNLLLHHQQLLKMLYQVPVLVRQLLILKTRQLHHLLHLHFH